MKTSRLEWSCLGTAPRPGGLRVPRYPFQRCADASRPAELARLSSSTTGRPRAAERYDVSWWTAAEVGGPLPRRGSGRDVRPLLAAASPAQPHPGPGGAQDRASAMEAAPGSGEIGDRLGMPSRRARRPGAVPAQPAYHVDRFTGEPIRRYEHERPGDLIHVDVKKLGKVPDGGGWRYLGRQQGERTAPPPSRAPAHPATSAQPADRDLLPAHRHRRPLPGRLRRGPRRRDQGDRHRRAAQRGRLVRRTRRHRPASAHRQRRLPTSPYLWRDTCAELGITPKRTRPYRPQTNGKIERFHRTLAEGWAFKKFYNSESARLAALPAWVHEYNHHRPHSAIGKRSPITRLDNLAGHHT